MLVHRLVDFSFLFFIIIIIIVIIIIYYYFFFCFFFFWGGGSAQSFCFEKGVLGDINFPFRNKSLKYLSIR